ncbi:MAG: polysaccharide export protein [Proteobacteria bacterium]|nr:polysaccharide export protein [Pseudomonadota bacterium]
MNCLKLTHVAAALLLLSPIAAQAQNSAAAPASSASAAVASDYLIGPGDELQVFVWKNPDLSVTLPVRPDGKISTPLVADIQAQGKTPTALAADLRTALGKYVQDPVVTVLVRTVATATGSAASIRVIGAAATPKSVPYRAGMTVLDVMIDVGGLNTYAAGNDAQIIRTQNGVSRGIPVHLADLMKSGDLKANVQLMPGDVVRIPERWF